MKNYMTYKDVNISTRLIVAFSFLFIIILAIVLVTTIQVKKAAVITQNIYLHPFTVTKAIRDIKINVMTMYHSMHHLAETTNETEINEIAENIYSSNRLAEDNFRIVYEKFLGKKSDIDDAYGSFLKWQTFCDSVILIANRGDRNLAYVVSHNDGEQRVDLLFGKIQGLIEFTDIEAGQYIDVAFEKYKIINRILIIFITFLILLGIGVTYYVVLSINYPINEIIAQIQKIVKKQFIFDLNIQTGSQMNMLRQSVYQLETVTERLNQEIEERNAIQVELEQYKNQLEDLFRKQSNELERTQELLSQAIDNADIGMIMVRPDGTFSRINRKFCEIIGYAEDAIINKHFRDITHPDDHGIDEKAIQQMINGEVDKTDIKKRYLHKNGSVIHVHLFIVLLRNEEGEPLYYFVQVQDISEQVMNAEKLANYSKNLESQVQIRTHELEGKASNLEESQQALRYLLEDVNDIRIDLEKSNRRFEQSNKELEAFSYSVSHDLRAPLRSIAGFSQVIMEDFADRLGKDGMHYFERIRSASQKMADLIDDMLSLSRITRQEISKMECSFSNICQDIANELIIEYDNKNVKISIQPDLTMEADLPMIKIALTNIIGNAFKFSSKKKNPEIEIGANSNDTQLVYFIKDNGTGFDMKYVDKLFSPFQRLHSNSEYPGTGIGLAIVQRIITKHGGRVWAESALLKGTTIYFTLSQA